MYFIEHYFDTIAYTVITMHYQALNDFKPFLSGTGVACFNLDCNDSRNKADP